METPSPEPSSAADTKGPPPIPDPMPKAPAAPPTTAGDIGAGAGPTPDATGGVIPYKNPAALIAYYLGVFGLVPMLGLPMAVAAIVLGFVGLRQRARRKVSGGQVHAWVGIVLGVASLGYHAAAIVLLGIL
ncbi:MAG: hypothetical protein ACIAS6_14230 [Phycisphaerales bacterium JB060]